jgi:hypothetical protein
LSCEFAESWSALGDALAAARGAFDAAEGDGLLESFAVGATGFVFAAAGSGAWVFSPPAAVDAGAGGSAATDGKDSGPQKEINRGTKIRIGHPLKLHAWSTRYATDASCASIAAPSRRHSVRGRTLKV